MSGATAGAPIRSLALIGNSAHSMINFRGALIADLVGAGLRVHALAPDYDEATRASVRALGAEPVDFSLDRAGMKPWRDLIDMVRLAATLRRLAPDAMLSYFVKPVIYGSLAGLVARVPRRFALVAGLGILFGEEAGGGARLLRAAVSLLYALGFAACARVFFQNEEDVAHFVERGLIAPAKPCRVNGTGVDLARLRPAPPVTRPVRFLLMARLLRAKGIVDYAEAARLVRAAHPTAEFVLLGGLDPNPDALPRALVEQWVADGLIDWHGHVDDVAPILARCSVYVLPSYYREGVPRSSQEAMAMAKPIITTNATGCRETVLDGVSGILVPARDPAALAAAMTRFIAAPALIGAMGRESRALAERRFDVRRINAEMLAAMGIAPRSP
jgi:glycosyltransferase involved in cell wall biosynthesis